MTPHKWLALALTLATAWMVAQMNLLSPGTALYLRDLLRPDILPGVVAAPVLWVWMMVHYYRNPGRHFRLLWAIVLLLGAHLGAMVYCVLVYLRSGAAKA